MDYFHSKFSGKNDITQSNAPPSNKGQGTQSGKELSSVIVPEIKVSFHTQEKMASNTKIRERYDGKDKTSLC